MRFTVVPRGRSTCSSAAKAPEDTSDLTLDACGRITGSSQHNQSVTLLPRLQLICDRLKPVFSECMVHWPPRVLTLNGSLYEIASYFGIPVGERGGVVHLWSNRGPLGRFAEISSSGRVKSVGARHHFALGIAAAGNIRSGTFVARRRSLADLGAQRVCPRTLQKSLTEPGLLLFVPNRRFSQIVLGLPGRRRTSSVIGVGESQQ